MTLGDFATRDQAAPPAAGSREARCLAVLVAAAQGGDACPTNKEIAAALDTSSTATAAYYVDLLERRGLIRVQRYQSTRVVEIVATGKKTAAPTDTTPHWRALKNPRWRPNHA